MLVKDDFAKKPGFMESVLSTLKPLSMQVEAIEGTKQTEEMMEVSKTNVLSLVVEANSRTVKARRFMKGVRQGRNLR